MSLFIINKGLVLLLVTTLLSLSAKAVTLTNEQWQIELDPATLAA